MLTIRPASLDDIPVLERLIARSVMELQAGDYSREQREGALGTLYGVDRQLIRDGSYYVAESDGTITGCGGWSRRKTLFGADAVPGRDDGALDPAQDAARIRAFFVDPGWARRGIGGRLLETCEAAAVAYGFTRLEMAATLTGVALYRAFGYAERERLDIPLPEGGVLPCVRMVKELPAAG
jgi:N-acetylglutamate synthase-like GNAT family acetyltransferase